MDLYAVLLCLMSILFTILQQFGPFDVQGLYAGLFDAPKLPPRIGFHGRTVDCTALKSNLFQSLKDRNVDYVNDTYRIYLSNCLKGDREQRRKLGHYFEKFLDVHMPAEERARDKETIVNTRVNRERQRRFEGDCGDLDDCESFPVDAVESINNCKKIVDTSPRTVGCKWSPDEFHRKSLVLPKPPKKSVQINPNPEFWYIEPRNEALTEAEINLISSFE